MIQGLSHITFVVQSLDLMSSFLETIFDAKEIYSSGEHAFSISREKFFLINTLWVAVMEGESLPDKPITILHSKFLSKILRCMRIASDRWEWIFEKVVTALKERQDPYIFTTMTITCLSYIQERFKNG